MKYDKHNTYDIRYQYPHVLLRFGIIDTSKYYVGEWILWAYKGYRHNG